MGDRSGQRLTWEPQPVLSACDGCKKYTLKSKTNKNAQWFHKLHFILTLNEAQWWWSHLIKSSSRERIDARTKTALTSLLISSFCHRHNPLLLFHEGWCIFLILICLCQRLISTPQRVRACVCACTVLIQIFLRLLLQKILPLFSCSSLSLFN